MRRYNWDAMGHRRTRSCDRIMRRFLRIVRLKKPGLPREVRSEISMSRTVDPRDTAVLTQREIQTMTSSNPERKHLRDYLRIYNTSSVTVESHCQLTSRSYRTLWTCIGSVPSRRSAGECCGGYLRHKKAWTQARIIDGLKQLPINVC